MERELTPNVTGELVKGLRSKLGMGFREFAKRCGVATATAHIWEHGQAIPNESGLAALAILAAREGYPNYAEAFTLLLNSGKLGRVFVGMELVANMAGLVGGHLRHADFLLGKSDVSTARLVLAQAIARLEDTLNEAGKVAPRLPRAETRKLSRAEVN
jgi:transcriptional regulator with XRE-family HTH domain